MAKYDKISDELYAELLTTKVTGPGYVPDEPEEPKTPDWFELNDETVTNERLLELKTNHFPKPPNITHALWTAPMEISERHFAVVNFAVMGLSNVEIGKELGLTPQRVGIILKHPLIRDTIKVKREEFYGNGRDYLQGIMKKAFGELEGILDSETAKDQTKLDAAKYVIDQTVGKAHQTISLDGGSFLKSVMERLDQAVATSAKVVAEKDEVDMMVETLEIEGIVVGKRNKETDVHG